MIFLQILDAGKYFSMVCQTDDDDSSMEDLSLTDDDNAKNGNGDGSRGAESDTSEPPKKRSSLVDPVEYDYADIRSPGSVLKSSRFLRKHATGDKWKVIVSNEEGVEVDDPNW